MAETHGAALGLPRVLRGPPSDTAIVVGGIGAAAIVGLLAATAAWWLLAAFALLGLVVAVIRRPVLAAYVLLALTPFLVGIERGRFLPLIRPNEALLLLLGLVLLGRFAFRHRAGVQLRLRFTRLDTAILVMAVTASVLPFLWLVARGKPLTLDDALSTLAIWKLYAVYVLLRATVRSEEQVRRCLAIVLGAAVIVAVIALLQSFDLGGIRGLLVNVWDARDAGSSGGQRASTTFGSSLATADYLAYALAIALAWQLRVRRSAGLAVVALLLLGGALAAAQFSGFIALVIVVVAVGWLLRSLRRLAMLAVPLAIIGVVVLWGPIAQRIAGFDSDLGVPQSWASRWDNVTTFYLPELGHFNFVLGVRPNQVLPAPEVWREVIFLESGHLWLLWVGGIPLLLAFAFFLVRAVQFSVASARIGPGAFGVAGAAAFASLCSVGILMVLDPHLTLRGAGDLQFALLAFSTTALAAAYGQSRRPVPGRAASIHDEAAAGGGRAGVVPISSAAAAAVAPAGLRSRPRRADRAHASRSQRVLDLVIAIPALVVLSPLLLAIAVAIRVGSPGRAIFRQERIGWRGQPFELLKFRTMVDGDDRAHRELVARQLDDGAATPDTSDAAFKLEDDPRVTGVGGWLRRLSIDELPQLINVVRGDMSIVGPRPALAYEVERYQPRHRARFEVRPGITGLWQVSGRNRLSMLEMLDLDCEYAASRSLRLDLRIVLKTPVAVVRGDGAR